MGIIQVQLVANPILVQLSPDAHTPEHTLTYSPVGIPSSSRASSPRTAAASSVSGPSTPSLIQTPSLPSLNCLIETPKKRLNVDDFFPSSPKISKTSTIMRPQITTNGFSAVALTMTNDFTSFEKRKSFKALLPQPIRKRFFTRSSSDESDNPPSPNKPKRPKKTK
ncbi:unnamed protein product [Parnassius apollo]|uniref:(apollo) hypothetical protein n=1 Tax=Parnassius apollo TaxID=110799 RepID=A0A8S3WY95_PARAO|nr:unnamed protein product [Parnassius apollo]